MSSRSRVDALSNVESLILAQAVWEHGANAWQAVAQVLCSHSLISRPKSFFTAQSSQVMYQNLMQEAGLERTEACDTIHSSVNHKLAEKFYTARVQELRELILAEEEKFKVIVSEIEAIRSGSFDAAIRAKITGLTMESTKPSPETKVPVITPSDELFDGSDLSGVSATSSSPSQTQEIPVTTTSATIDPPQQFEESEGLKQTPIVLKDDAQVGDRSTPVVAEGIPRRDAEKEQEITETGNQPSLDRSKSVSSSANQTVGQETSQEKDLAVSDKTREEEEDDENEVANEVVAVLPRENVESSEPPHEQDKSTESPSQTPGEIPDMADSSQEGLTPVQNEALESLDSEFKAVADVEAEVVVEDGESSGEEPLTISRRSTRRRRSTLSPVQQVQTRGKARRQRPESPFNTRDESEIEMEDNEELHEETPKVETDRDVSPVLGGARRGQGKRKASFIEVDSPRDKKRARDDSEPVDEDETGQNHGRGRRPGIRSEGHKRFQAVMGMLHSQISQHRNGNIFHNPIKNSEAPDYHEIVKRPMDLKTIKMKVKDGSIGTSLEFQRDIMLMFANAMMYNRPGSDVHTMAEDMMIESENHINAFRQTEGLVRGARHV